MQLEIKKINVEIEDRMILKDFSLEIGKGEVHVIMGPNGVGKSTLSRVIMGDDRYKVVSGDILFNGESILEKSVDERSRLGIFLAMQSPLEIDGVSNQDFLRTAMAAREDKRIGLYEFILKCEKATDELGMNKELIHRNLNIGFSGGEKKKNEVLQIKLLEPSLIFLDEIDSGLDVDSLKVVCENLLDYKEKYPETSFVIVTHYAGLLSMFKPDFVHVLYDGKIVKTGDNSLAFDILENGFSNYLSSADVIDEGGVCE